MTFLHMGLFAAGIASITIPIAVHLLMRRRRKPVLWGAMRFVLEAYRRQRRRLMIERWLLLATRCAILALVAIALGRPLLAGSAGSESGRTIVLLIDNSLAAGAADQSGTALERHKALAIAILGTLGASASGQTDRAALVALGGPAQEIVLPPSSNLAEITRLVGQIELTDSRADLSGALTRVSSALEADPVTAQMLVSGAEAASPRVFVVVLSDFLAGSADPAAALPRLPRGAALLGSAPAGPGSAPSLNVAITGVEPAGLILLTGVSSEESQAGPDARVRITLRRSGEESAGAGVSTIRLLARHLADRNASSSGAPAGAAAQETRATAQWGPGEEETSISLQLPPLPRSTESSPRRTLVLTARIDNDAIEADNTFARPIDARSSLRVGVLAPQQFGDRSRVDQLDAAEWLRLALSPTTGPDSGAAKRDARDNLIEFSYLDLGSLDIPHLAGLDVVIVPRPDLVSPGDGAGEGSGGGEGGWDRLGWFLRAGGLVVVTPPADQTVHTWPDAMSAAFNLAWKPARETVVLDEPAQLVASPTDLGNLPDLLGQLRAELTELTRPVQVTRLLPVVLDPGAPSAPSPTDGTAPERGAALLFLGDGSPFIYIDRPQQRSAPATPAPLTPSAGGAGVLIYLAAAPDMDWTDLPAKPLMVPLIQELVRQGASAAQGARTAVAGLPILAPPRAAELIQMSGASTGETAARAIAVDASGFASEPIRTSSLWSVTDERGAVRGALAVNPDHRAGRVTPNGLTELERWLAAAAADGAVSWVQPSQRDAADPSLGFALRVGNAAPPVSLPFLAAALGLALLEVLLARRASHAEITMSPAQRAAA
ncbi:MAG: BatA domain-containing protein [Phycisphaerales bacterium]|nr:BatA domain-containing protein [Phycisphaerales bacterium]